MRWKVCFSLLLSAILTGSFSPGTLVTVSRGQDAVLNCSFNPKQPDNTETSIQWIARKHDDEPFFQCDLKNDWKEDGENCAGSELKYSLMGDPRLGDASLLVRDAQLSDNGTFFCRVMGRLRKDLVQRMFNLYVEAKPQILSLSVVNASCGSHRALQRLQCDIEGHPLPEVVWLAVSRLKLDDQGETTQSDSHRVTSCIPYPWTTEERGDEKAEEVTCRAESRLDHAERTYPERTNLLMVVGTVCGLAGLLLVAGITVYCVWKKCKRKVVSAPEEIVYSSVTVLRSESPSCVHSKQHHKEPAVVYAPVKACR